MTPLENALHWTVVALFGLGVLGYASAFGLQLQTLGVDTDVVRDCQRPLRKPRAESHRLVDFGGACDSLFDKARGDANRRCSSSEDAQHDGESVDIDHRALRARTTRLRQPPRS